MRLTFDCAIANRAYATAASPAASAMISRIFVTNASGEAAAHRKIADEPRTVPGQLGESKSAAVCRYRRSDRLVRVPDGTASRR